jgi:hypothetical protein
MAGTVTQTRGFNASSSGAVPVNFVAFSWTSDSSGNADATSEQVTGVILRVAFNPGSAAPTDNYDVTLSDADGIDVLAGQGANRDTTTSEHICPGVALYDGTTTSVVPVAVFSPLTLAVTNAGSAKTGTVTVYYR